MYSERHIPRRPWSPDEYAATSSFSPATGLGQHARQREPSDSSVEALDLVDYASTLRRAPDFNRPFLAAARSISPPLNAGRPFSSQSMSIPSPPSLYTGPSTASTTTRDFSAVGRQTTLPHIELPSPPHYAYPPAPYPAPASYPYSHDADRLSRYELGGLEDDLDIRKFPSWSREWFKEHGLGNRPVGHLPELDLADSYSDPYYDRDLLPWSSQRSDSIPVSPGTKEERLRMLQKEFGKNRPGMNGRLESDSAIIGGVDEKGNLITGGRKKRIATRVAQALLVLIAGSTSIYAALFIKILSPATPPPPSHHFATYALYILSILTFLAITYMFALKPCCCPGIRPGKEDNFTGAASMMVMPIQGQQNKKRKKGKKGQKGMMMPQQDVQVNLIVDPTMFGGGQDRDREWDNDEDEDPNRTIRPAAPRRRGLMAGFAMEAAWKVARAKLKRHIAFNAIFMIIWGAEFVLILMGPRCPSGQFNGWCEAFNLATASACFLVLAFALSVYFGIRDLHASKVSPRTRT